MRSISRWVAPPLSSVQMVVCRCGFKTFNLGLPRDKGAESNVLPVGPHGARRTRLSASDQRGQGGAVWVAISGALWVAAGVDGYQSSNCRAGTSQLRSCDMTLTWCQWSESSRRRITDDTQSRITAGSSRDFGPRLRVCGCAPQLQASSGRTDLHRIVRPRIL